MQSVGRQHLFHTRGRLRTASVNPQHGHAESRAQACSLAPYAADANDEGGGCQQVNDVVFGAWAPLAQNLARNVMVQAARKRQDEGHDVGTNVVVENFALIGDNDVFID